MSQYPTEEEEFEMLYGEEMAMMEEMQANEENINPVPRSRITSKPPIAPISIPQPHAASPAALSQDSQNISIPAADQSRPGTSRSFFQQSPALSQISFDTTATQEGVNRRLFGTPHPNGDGNRRVASTPFEPQAASAQEILAEYQQLGLESAARKRRLEDLFGDIGDIDEVQVEQNYQALAKKSRTEEEIDMEMIEKILAKRRVLQAQLNPLRNTNLEKLEALHKFKMQNLSYTLPRYPFTTLVRYDKERVYVRMHSMEFEEKQIDEISFGKNGGIGGLLGAARQEMWMQAQQIINDRLALTDKPPAATIEEIPIIVNEEDSNLWVEKYRPKKYTDLLSDETTNRSLLSWLKLWDKVVFNKEFNAESINSGPENSFNRKTGKFEPFGRFRKKPLHKLNTDVDSLGRPMQKVALLCGPPGLGKTTLAHTIAKHAGYSVREINASDDRSPEAFKLALQNGTQMRSVLNREQRPNCIILDEIDGAPTPAIEYLIKFINDNGTQPSQRKGIKTKPTLLKRPIICICNDMYVASLRQLRQIAFVVNFPQLESARLAERLLAIARRENVKTDLTAALALAEKTGNDVRSCLSMLQFFNSIKRPLTLIDVLKSNIGQKDRHKGLFGVWGSIFQIQRPRKMLTEGDVADLQIVSMSDTSIKTRMKNVLDVVHMGGDYERLMSGVYENYLSQKMPDPNMVGVTEALEWFCFSDRIQRFINQRQNYAVYPYLQYGFVIWHFLFATMAWPKITFPNKGFEYSQKTNVQHSIQNALRKGLSANSCGVGEGSSLLLDTVPLLRRVLTPSLRSVSLQLLSPKERADLRHSVEVMADLGLVYVQSKAVDGTYQYRMEPDIDIICHFDVPTGTSALSYWGRQIIAREVELEQMRRAAPKAQANGSSTTTASKRPPEALKSHKTNIISPPSAQLPNHLQKLRPITINSNSKFKETVSKDFFGRMSSKQTSITVQEGGTDVIVKSPIWYRYKEGCNNAVRKDVTVQNLL